MTIAQDLHDKFAGREHFTSDDIRSTLPELRLGSAQSIICRFKGVHFEIIMSGMYKVIGDRPPTKPPGQNKGAPKFKNPPVKRKVGEIIIDWMTRPISLPFGAEGWRK